MLNVNLRKFFFIVQGILKENFSLVIFNIDVRVV